MRSMTYLALLSLAQCTRSHGNELHVSPCRNSWLERNGYACPDDVAAVNVRARWALPLKHKLARRVKWIHNKYTCASTSMSAQTLPAYFSYSLCLYGDYTFILELPSTQQSTSNQTGLWGTSCVLKLSLCFNGTQNKLFYTLSTFFCAVVLCSIRCNGKTCSSNESLENTGIVLLVSKCQTPLKEVLR